MAKFKILEFNKPIPEYHNSSSCLIGKDGDHYVLMLDNVKIALTSEEKANAFEIWDKIDSGVLGNG